MFFKGRDTYEDIEFRYPIKNKINELKREKEQLEEYYRQLIFIIKILRHILSIYSNESRRSFSIDKEWDNCFIIEALNSLLKDVPSFSSNSFSKVEIEGYIKELTQELELVDVRIKYIINEMDRYS